MQQIRSFSKLRTTVYQYKKNMKDNIIKKLKESEEEIERGEGIESDVAFEELRQKYGY